MSSSTNPMKIKHFLFVLLLIAPLIVAAAPVSVEEFKKISSPEARQKIINEAPLDQKEELQRIDMHLQLVTQYGGEEALKSHKMAAVTRARGLIALVNVFDAELNDWTYYFGRQMMDGDKAGMPQEKLDELNKQSWEKRADLEKRWSGSYGLLYPAAASPQALELEKRAEKLLQNRLKRYSKDPLSPIPATKEELMGVDKQLDQIFEEIKRLPKLPPEELQKEYDSYPEEKLYRKMTSREAHPCFGICEASAGIVSACSS